MDNGKREAVRVSEILGCALLFSMLVLLAASLGEAKAGAEDAQFFFKMLRLVGFFLPAIWGVWRFRRLAIRFPAMSEKASLNKNLAVILSTFGVIMIIQIFYAAIFPSVVPRAGVESAETATEIFMLFFFSTLIPAVTEELFFRGFFMRSMRIFRASLAVLMSALVFALMGFSVEGFPLLFVTGLLLGMAYVATNSLHAVIAVQFLCRAFWFLEETIGLYMPQGYMHLMQVGLAGCVLLSASGLPYLKENMRAFFENNDERAIPSAYFWTVPTILFVGLSAGIQLLM